MHLCMSQHFKLNIFNVVDDIFLHLLLNEMKQHSNMETQKNFVRTLT